MQSVIIATHSAQYLTALLPVVPSKSVKFANGEIKAQIRDSIRGKDVYLLMTGAEGAGWNVNDNIMNAMVLLDACRRADVNSITLICPCFPYIRQDKKDQPREPISARMLANMLEPYIDRLVVVDAHFAQFQGFFSVPVENLYAINLLYRELEKLIEGHPRGDYVLVSPDNGGAKRLEHYARLLCMPHVIMNKRRDYARENMVYKTDLYYDPESVSLQGKIGILVDDIVDSAGTIVSACKTLDSYGFSAYIIVCTHGIFSPPAFERLSKDNILAVLTTDSVDQTENKKIYPRLQVATIGPLLYNVINMLQSNASISSLFE